MNLTNEYKPLPDFLTIKESDIHGLGLFTKKDLPESFFLVYLTYTILIFLTIISVYLLADLLIIMICQIVLQSFMMILKNI